MKILVTAGATREPIDAVRFLSNISTGATGAALADEFVRHGHTVVCLSGEGAVASKYSRDTEQFSSADDLRARLKRRLGEGEFDAVVMAAAVADYRPAKVIEGKIPSAAEALTLALVRNEKIIPWLKSYAVHPLKVIGFKLTAGAGDAGRREAIMAQFAAGGVDAVVHNDLAEMRASPVHPFYLWPASEAPVPVRLEGVPALAVALEEFLATRPA
jgi:phosphopantothenate---cysteine ligase (CTP)